MESGKVTEVAVLRKGLPGLENRRLLMVRLHGKTVGALDCIGAEPGDRVLLVRGQAAMALCMEAAVDTAAVAVLAPSPETGEEWD